MTHDHTFGQDEPRPGERRTRLVVLLTVTMMVAEIIAGVMFGSMALLADGLHMASHSVALGLALIAYVYARRHAADRRFSFGTGKVNALAGFSGALLLAVFAMGMALESVSRFVEPVSIEFNQAILVACLGLVVNVVSALLLQSQPHSHGADAHAHSHAHGHDHAHEQDLNLRSAYLHVLADALTSVAAIAALLSGKYLGWNWMDPTMGLVGSALVATWSWSLMRSSARVLLDHQAPLTWCRRSARPSSPKADRSPTCTSGRSARASGRPRSVSLPTSLAIHMTTSLRFPPVWASYTRQSKCTAWRRLTARDSRRCVSYQSAAPDPRYRL